jgi:hypothetical protein
MPFSQIIRKAFDFVKDDSIFAPLQKRDSVAQLVEQYTFNVWVLGSSPSRVTQTSSISERFFFYKKTSPALVNRA